MNTRRQFAATSLAATACAAMATKLYAPKYSISYRKKTSTVAVLDISEYDSAIEGDYSMVSGRFLSMCREKACC
jgi:hypothetical protein